MMSRTKLRMMSAAPLLLLASLSGLVATDAAAQASAKKDYVARILKAQQPELEALSRGVVERPAAQMMQDAGTVIQRQVPADKREAVGRAIDAEVKKYVDESYLLVRERALRLAPSTVGAVLEEKMTEEELKQFATWLESSANKKFQQLGPDMRNAFIGKLLTESQPVVDPKLQALEGKIRTILGIGPAAPGSAAPPAARATPAAPKASAK